MFICLFFPFHPFSKILIDFCGPSFVELSTWGQFHQRSTSSFYACRSQKRKKTVKLSSFIVLLGSARVKVACRTLVKLTLGVYVCGLMSREIRIPLMTRSRFQQTFFTHKRIFLMFGDTRPCSWAWRCYYSVQGIRWLIP